MVRWDHLKWEIYTPKNFIIGPLGSGSIQDESYRKAILGSEGSEKNSIPYLKKSKTGEDLFGVFEKNWKLYACKFCQMWIYAYNQLDDLFMVPANNILQKKVQNPLDFKNGPNVSIKAPVLKKLSLDDLLS